MTVNFIWIFLSAFPLHRLCPKEWTSFQRIFSKRSLSPTPKDYFRIILGCCGNLLFCWSSLFVFLSLALSLSISISISLSISQSLWLSLLVHSYFLSFSLASKTMTTSPQSAERTIVISLLSLSTQSLALVQELSLWDPSHGNLLTKLLK